MSYLVGLNNEKLTGLSGEYLVSLGHIAPVSTTITIHYTGQDLAPSVSISNQETETYKSSLTLRGTADSKTSSIKIYLNSNLVKEIFFSTQEDHIWECPLPYLSMSANNISVEAINNLSGRTAQATKTITYRIPLATDYQKVIPYMVIDGKYRPVNPRVLRNGKIVEIATYLGIMSASVTAAGVTGYGHVGTPVGLVKSNSVNITGVTGYGSVGAPTGYEKIYSTTVSGVTGYGNVGTPVGMKYQISTAISAGNTFTYTTSARLPATGYWSAPSGEKISSLHFVSNYYANITIYCAESVLPIAQYQWFATDHPNFWLDITPTSGIYMVCSGGYDAEIKIPEVKTSTLVPAL